MVCPRCFFIRKIIDPLTDGDSSIKDESGASPATVTYSYDAYRSQQKVTSTSRTGFVTNEWYDALGRISQMLNPLGALTEYLYDTVGNLIREVFTPAAGVWLTASSGR